jgi:hypothetical protein
VTFSLGSGVFIYLFRNNDIVKVGQPPFIYLLCFGSSLVGASLFFTAIDESSGHSLDVLDFCCVASSWFSYIGSIIIYMALFCKLWRVQKVTRFRKGQVILVRHVIWPFVTMLLTVIGVLIAYTIKDPSHWTREDDMGSEEQLTYGHCDRSSVYGFVLDGLVLASVFMVLWMSCLTRDVPESISDSRRVRQTLCWQAVLGIMSFLVLILSNILESSPSFYTGLLVLDFFSAILAVAFVVVPKIYYVHVQQTTGHLPSGVRRQGTVRVTGVTPPIVPKSVLIAGVSGVPQSIQENEESKSEFFVLENKALGGEESVTPDSTPIQPETTVEQEH